MSTQRKSLLWPCLCLGFAFATSLTGADIPTPAADKKPGKPLTHTVGKGAIKARSQLDAVLESQDMRALKLEPKIWADFTVLEAVPHGSRVKAGDTLVKFDTEKINEQIEDQSRDLPGLKLALELATSELENLNQTTPQKLEAARRAYRIAVEDADYFESTGRLQREKNSRFNVKSAEQRLEGAQEELKQLEKMYKADDLTEETEEIILKRQKFQVEAAVLGLESSKLMTDRDLNVVIPREHETHKNARKDQTFNLAFNEFTLPGTLSKKKLDVDKQKRDYTRSARKLEDLKKDLGLMTVKAPAEGLVYYGMCEAGRWTSAAMIAKKLVPTGKLMANEVFITIVNPEKMLLRAVLQEADLAQYKLGAIGRASPISDPDKRLPVKLTDLGVVPQPGGGFEAKIFVDLSQAPNLMPGMTCKVHFGPESKPDALVIPKEAIFSEEGKSLVYVAKKDAKPEMRAIKTGVSDDKLTEVTEGLAEGDIILLARPD